MSASQPPAVVIENGAWTIKAGVAADDKPRVIIPTLVGSKKSAEDFQLAVGDEVKADYDDMCPHWTFEGDSCSNWDDLTALWKQVYNNVKVEPETRNVLTTVSVTTPKPEREKMMEVFFETLKVPGCYIAYDSVLAMYACGRLSGTVVDCGHTATNIVPISEGFALHENRERMPFGGKALSEYLAKLISKNVQLNTDSLKIFEVAKIKESLATLMPTADTQKYTLPDGKTFELDKEMLQCAEAYFKPKLLDPNSDGKGLPQWIYKSIQSCDMDLRQQLVSNIVLTGGSSIIPGFSERLTQEMQALNARAKVIANSDRQNYTFVGGAVLASLEAMESQWVTKAEYAEKGATIVNTKCA